MRYLWTEDTGAGLHFWKLVNQLFFDNEFTVESKGSNQGLLDAVLDLNIKEDDKYYIAFDYVVDNQDIRNKYRMLKSITDKSEGTVIVDERRDDYMTVQEWEKDFYGNNVTITTRDNECVIYRIRDDSGDSVLTRFEVYPGIALIYNDVHTDYISIKELVGYENILEINHCREGRIEFESSEGECLYVKKGDMAINMKAGVKSYSYFPQSHYHGVTIEIDFDKIEKNQNMIMKEMQLSPKILQDKFCNHKQCIVLHEKQEFEHLFSEIYCVPEQIKKSYYKIKVMEILLFLFALDTTKEKIENRYFNKNLVAKVKEIHQYMLNHIDEKLTIACLADKHQISATNLKKYFKEIYGLSIYAYLKEKRIQKAAELLRETNHEIGKIAGMVGYDNASKFSNSFKSIMGINPSEYKKSV